MTTFAKKLAFVPRILSAGFRPLPNFIIVGGQKCGSSALYKFISQHPDVKRAFVKEPHYFSGEFSSKSKLWYRAQFPRVKAHQQTGEASPSYCTHPLAPKRIKEQIPDCKLVFIVRNPVDRAVSNYYHSVKYGVEDLDIEKAFDRPMELFDEEYQKMADNPTYKSSFYNRHAYIHKGLYMFHLKRWTNQFPRHQILILENENLLIQPQQTYDKLCHFLDLPSFKLNQYGKHNVGNSKVIAPHFKKHLEKQFEKSNAAFFNAIGKKFDW